MLAKKQILRSLIANFWEHSGHDGPKSSDFFEFKSNGCSTVLLGVEKHMRDAAHMKHIMCPHGNIRGIKNVSKQIGHTELVPIEVMTIWTFFHGMFRDFLCKTSRFMKSSSQIICWFLDRILKLYKVSKKINNMQKETFSGKVH